MADDIPKAFISYSWDDDPHKAWVKAFAARLRGDGVDVTLDQWSTVPGDRLPEFMEKAIRDNTYVLIVCTPNYKAKSDGRKGGVGYEGDIMNGEVFTTRNHRKFIPVLRKGKFSDTTPTWLVGAYGIDLSKEPYDEAQYDDLLTTLFKRREQAPPIGQPKPAASKSLREAAKEFMPTKEQAAEQLELIRITGIIMDEIGEPMNDGTPGSALYSVPFRLSRKPTNEWGHLFLRVWDHPPRFSTRHRPGTARVQGDKIILTRTTVEEVKEVHRDTLKLCVEETNKRAEEIAKQRHAENVAEEQIRQVQKDQSRKIAGEIDFS